MDAYFHLALLMTLSALNISLLSHRSTMIRSMLLECQGMLSDGGAIREQSSSLLHGIEAKVHQPLFQRPTCRKCRAITVSLCIHDFVCCIYQPGSITETLYIVRLRGVTTLKTTTIDNMVSLQVAWKTVLNTL